MFECTCRRTYKHTCGGIVSYMKSWLSSYRETNIVLSASCLYEEVKGISIRKFICITVDRNYLHTFLTSPHPPLPCSKTVQEVESQSPTNKPGRIKKQQLAYRGKLEKTP